MLDKEKHQLIMGQILKDIYTDVQISSLLGFKGGTCAYLFYGLPRFSVDLDFDLLSTDEAARERVFEKMKTIAARYGVVKDSFIKRYNVFLLLSYGVADHNIKMDINTRMFVPDTKAHYEIREHLGISMLVGRKDYLFASKLAALTTRSAVVMRDIYDIWYFAKNSWDINPEIIRARIGKTVKEYLADCVAVVEQVKDNGILQGLGELINEKEKAWVKKDLKKEVVFLLRNYQAALK